MSNEYGRVELDSDTSYYFVCSTPSDTGGYEVLLLNDHIVEVNKDAIQKWPYDEVDDRPEIPEERRWKNGT